MPEAPALPMIVIWGRMCQIYSATVISWSPLEGIGYICDFGQMLVLPSVPCTRQVMLQASKDMAAGNTQAHAPGRGCLMLFLMSWTRPGRRCLMLSLMGACTWPQVSDAVPDGRVCLAAGA